MRVLANSGSIIFCKFHGLKGEGRTRVCFWPHAGSDQLTSAGFPSTAYSRDGQSFAREPQEELQFEKLSV
jgi:hypothetical protein